MSESRLLTLRDYIRWAVSRSTPPACSSVTAPTMPGTRRATWFWAPCTFLGNF